MRGGDGLPAIFAIEFAGANLGFLSAVARGQAGSPTNEAEEKPLVMNEPARAAGEKPAVRVSLESGAPSRDVPSNGGRRRGLGFRVSDQLFCP